MCQTRVDRVLTCSFLTKEHSCAVDQPTPTSSWYRAMFSGWYCELSEMLCVCLRFRAVTYLSAQCDEIF